MGRAQHCIDQIASEPPVREADGPTSHEQIARSARQQQIETPWIVLLTKDAELRASIREAADALRITTVESVERAEEAASAGRCQILITDEASTHRSCAAVGERLRRHAPAMVMIAVGNRGEDNALIGLLSAGVADRLMLKPVTPALSRIVIESAAREHQSRRTRCAKERQPRSAMPRLPAHDENSTTQPARIKVAAIAVEKTPSRVERNEESRAAPIAAVPSRASFILASLRTWLAVVAAAFVIGGWAWWIASQPVSSPADTQAPPAMQAADRWLVDAARSIDQSRFVDAIYALQSARRAGASDDGIASVEARLRYALEKKISLASANFAGDPLSGPVVPPVYDQVPTAESGLAAKATAPAAPAEKAMLQPDPEDRREASGGEPVRDRPVAKVEPVKLASHAQADEHSVLEVSSDVLAPPQQRAAEFPGTELPLPNAPAAAQSNAALPPATDRKVVRMVKPEYPSEARVRGIQGWTDLSFSVSASGDVLDPRIEDSSMRQLFARPALSAVKQWKYEPAFAGGTSMPERVRVRMEFRAHD